MSKQGKKQHAQVAPKAPPLTDLGAQLKQLSVAQGADQVSAMHGARSFSQA